MQADNEEVLPTETPTFKGFDTPRLFTIPMIYEDVCILRDRNKYLRIQELEKKFAELRNQIIEVMKKHQARYDITRSAISVSTETLNRFMIKKNRVNNI